MKIITAIKLNIITWALITLCVLVPYLAVRIYLPSVPYAMYYYFVVLAAIKFIIFNDRSYRIKLKPKLENYLSKELKKNPSKQEIITRTESMLFVRDISLMIFAIIGVFVNIIL